MPHPLNFLAKRTIAIYEQREDGQPLQRGSAVLLRVADIGFAVSAAHVLSIENSAALLFAPMEGNSSFLHGELKIAFTQDQERIDLGFARLPQTVTDALSRQKEFISLADILRQAVSRNEPHAIYGYPISETHTKHSERQVEVNPLFYCCRSVEAATQEYPEWCIHLSYKDATVKRMAAIPGPEDWNTETTVRMPYLKGISGCGIWQMDPTGQAAPILAGIEHGIMERSRIIRGTVARYLPAIIAEHNPDLRSIIRISWPEL